MKRLALASALVIVPACFTPPPPPDAAAADARAGDAARDAGLRFGPADRIAELASLEDERSAALAADGLALYLTRDDPADDPPLALPYRSARPSRIEPFAAPVALDWGQLSARDLELANSELELYFWSGLGELYRSSRASAAADWSLPEALGFDGFSPSLSGNLLSLYFVDAGGALWRSRRESPVRPWLPPEPVALSTKLKVCWIDVSADELTLLVTADPEAPGAGVYLAQRHAVGEPFAPLRPIASLSGPYEGARFSADGSEITALADVGGQRDVFRSLRDQ